MIRYSEQYIDQKDISKVIKTLNQISLLLVPQISLFEKNLSEKVNSKYSVVFNSATSALHTACLALGLKKGDRLWTSANSFVASANCGLYCGAKIDLIDIELDTFNIDLEKLEKIITCKKIFYQKLLSQ